MHKYNFSINFFYLVYSSIIRDKILQKIYAFLTLELKYFIETSQQLFYNTDSLSHKFLLF